MQPFLKWLYDGLIPSKTKYFQERHKSSYREKKDDFDGRPAALTVRLWFQLVCDIYECKILI